MYIWILLATIMVALSFFNTSPREDKASVFTEIKASTFINRFRAEHIAYFRTLECEIILNPTHSLDDSKAVMELSNPSYINYTSVQKNLPIGYDQLDNTYQIAHDLYCFDDDLRSYSSNHDVNFQNCMYATHRYLFSYAPIPERWLSKVKTTISMGKGKPSTEINAPLPAFTNYLAKDLHGMKNTGWVWCNANECHLAGKSSIQTLYNNTGTTDDTRSKYINFTFPDVIFNQPETTTSFLSVCLNQPCMFSFEKFKTTDTSGHCRGLMNSANNNNTGTN